MLAKEIILEKNSKEILWKQRYKKSEISLARGHKCLKQSNF